MRWQLIKPRLSESQCQCRLVLVSDTSSIPTDLDQGLWALEKKLSFQNLNLLFERQVQPLYQQYVMSAYFSVQYKFVEINLTKKLLFAKLHLFFVSFLLQHQFQQVNLSIFLKVLFSTLVVFVYSIRAQSSFGQLVTPFLSPTFSSFNLKFVITLT